MLKNSTRIIVLYCLIIIVGLCLRLYRLDQSPPRLTIDEMSIGYNVYSIIETGKDEWGKSLPLIFRAFGDYKLPAYIYSTIPFIFAFGLNPVSIRLVSVIAGLLNIMLTGYIAFRMSKHHLVGLIAALLMAINPWPVFISRMALESNLGLCLFLFGLVFTIKMVEMPKAKYAILAGVFYSLTFYTYIAYRVIVILLLVFLSINYLKKNQLRKKIVIILITVSLCLLPLINRLIDFSGQARFQQISIFKDQGFTSEVNEDRSFCYLQDRGILASTCPFFFNKPASWLNALLINYSSYYFPDYLFINGDTNHYLSVPGFGEYFLVFLPFYLLGIIFLVTKRDGLYRLILAATLISPIPSALAGEPHAVRGSSLLPFIAIITALGIVNTFKLINTRQTLRICIMFLLFAVCYQGFRYYLNYLFIYPAQFDDAAYPLPPKLGHYLNAVQSKYQKIYFDNIGPGLHMFVAYYTAYPPANYQQDVVWPIPDSIGFTHPKFLGKYEFGTKSLDAVLCSNQTNALYISGNDSNYTADDIFMNFSGIHELARAYDIDNLRKHTTTKCSNTQ